MESSLALLSPGRWFRDPAGPMRASGFTLWKSRQPQALLGQTKGQARPSHQPHPLTSLPAAPTLGFHLTLSPSADVKCEAPRWDKAWGGVLPITTLRLVGWSPGAHGIWRQNFAGLHPYVATSRLCDRGEDGGEHPCRVIVKVNQEITGQASGPQRSPSRLSQLAPCPGHGLETSVSNGHRRFIGNIYHI